MDVPDNIFIIGPMGVGKTTIGRHLATTFKKTFLDTDQELEKRTGADISLIFEIEGEAGFRKRESSILDELTKKKNLVLATGGGAILSEGNRRMLRKNGFVLYLSADVETLVNRTRKDKSRPLLQTEDKRKTLTDMMATRDPLYRQEADLIIKTDNRPPAVVARDVAAHIQKQPYK